MGSRSMIASFGLILGVLVGGGCADPGRDVGDRRGGAPSHDAIAGPARLTVAAAELHRTVVTAHLEESLAGNRNVIWCATFQLAWDELAKEVGGEVALDEPVPMVDALNRGRIRERLLDRDSYVARAGIGRPDLIEEVQAELRRKFGGAERPQLLPTSNLIAYAYLFKALPFETAFDRRPFTLAGFGRVRHECFGIHQPRGDQKNRARKAGQVRVLDYRNQNDLVIELVTTSKRDRLILAKVPPDSTLQLTVEAVGRRCAASRSRPMQEGSHLLVPVLDFDILRTYDELTGRRVQSPGGEWTLPIGEARQQTRFRLDETGAVLKSEAVMPTIGMTDDTETYIFDRPFLVMLEQAGAQSPYLAVWIANEELLVPSPALDPATGPDIEN